MVCYRSVNPEESKFQTGSIRIFSIIIRSRKTICLRLFLKLSKCVTFIIIQRQLSKVFPPKFAVFSHFNYETKVETEVSISPIPPRWADVI